MNDTILKALNIRKAYREGSISTQVLRGASMEARRGMATAIIGRSGSGKSTLLHILGTLDTPDSGSLMFNGEDLTKLSDSQKAAFRSKNLGFVYQFHHLLPDFSALENVMMPLLIAGMGMRQARQRAAEYLSLVGLEGKFSSRPSEMSGGERQRAAIARALCFIIGKLRVIKFRISRGAFAVVDIIRQILRYVAVEHHAENILLKVPAVY